MRARRDGFRAFASSRHPALLRTAYLLTGDQAQAEDLVQDALARTWLAWPRLGGPAAADAHVRRALVAAASRGRRRAPATDDPLWSALAALPRRERVALVLRVAEELSEDEVAQLLGLSTRSVAALTTRALTRVRPHTPAQTRTGPTPATTAWHGTRRT